MYFYPFSDEGFRLIKDSLSICVIDLKNRFKNSDKSWDFIYIEFAKPIEVTLKNNNNDSVKIILDGDKRFTEFFAKQLKSIDIEFGFRWEGCNDGTRRVYCKGLGIKLASKVNTIELKKEAIDFISQALCDNNLLHEKDKSVFSEKFLQAVSSNQIQQTFSSSFANSKKHPSFFQNKERITHLQQAQSYISKNIKLNFAKYKRNNEDGINTTYQTIENIDQGLQLNEKRIWLLRGDFILALGIKNSYWISFGYEGLSQAIDEKLHCFIDWDNRGGHPTLALEYPGYDSSAYYGGYICQRDGYLQVFTSSGRFYRDDLQEPAKKILESYIAYQFQQAYGEQDVIFFDGPYDDFFELSLFFSNQLFPATIKGRKYDSSRIDEVLQELVHTPSTSPS